MGDDFGEARKKAGGCVAPCGAGWILKRSAEAVGEKRDDTACMVSSPLAHTLHPEEVNRLTKGWKSGKNPLFWSECGLIA